MTDTAARAHGLTLKRRYFELVAAGEKTIEVRARYPRFESLAAGDTLRFQIKGTNQRCEVLVRRVTRYETFEALLDGECLASIDPESTREQQLANMREIYPPEKERLGVLAIEIELLG